LNRNEQVRQLLLKEAGENRTPRALTEAAARVSARICLPFVDLIGRKGTDAVLSRAINLAAREFPFLETVEKQGEDNVSLDQVWRVVGGRDSDEVLAAAAAIFAAFLDLLGVFGGESLTFRSTEAELSRHSRDPGERIRDLNCLYGVSALLDRIETPLEEVLEAVVALIPPAYQYPEVTCARVVVNRAVFKSANWRQSRWRQTSNISIQGRLIGRVEVCYLEKRPQANEGPFLREERNLIDEIAVRLAHAIGHRQAVEALRSSEDKLRLLLDNLQEGVWFVDKEACTTYVNPRMAEILCYTVDEMLGRQLFSFMDKRAAKIAKHNLRRRQAGIAERRDVELLNKMGERVLTTMATSPVTDSDGQYVGALAAVADVTELRREKMRRGEAESAVRRSEERYRFVVEHAQDVIYLYRFLPKPHYEYVSPSAEAILGYKPAEFYADPTLRQKTVHPGDLASFNEFTSFPDRWAGHPLQLRRIRKDGTVISTEQTYTAILDESGHLVASEGVVRDITERVRAEEELDRLRSEFLGMVSHELRTPLTAIKGSAAVALSSLQASEHSESRELLQIIDQQADRLRDLIADMLDMTRIEAGILSVNCQPSDLGETVREAAAVFSRSGFTQPIQVKLPECLPLVYADAHRVVQVVTNLLNNAGRLSPSSTPIELLAEPDNAYVTVRVRDHGIGIPKAKLGQLFQKFSQLQPKPGGGFEGTGLGLAICKGIIEAHGGRIWAESAGEGQGSTFSFTLPFKEE
jgi:PAS domain S-box-containing protein